MMPSALGFNHARSIEQLLASIPMARGPYAFSPDHKVGGTATAFCADDRISFTTKGGTRVQGGLVLEVDLCAVLPVRVEYHVPGYGKRIERFHPDEFINFQKEFCQ